MKSNLIETRQIRIFISSTFRDMMAERDHLLHKVFPELRRYCAERDVTLFELDLRWGISEEESKQGKVVDICLKEIQNTTPFFIGLLGERYGWAPSPKEVHKNIKAYKPVFENHPRVQDDLKHGTSITEIEIQEGVLRSPEKVNAYFYIRSPRMDVSKTKDYKEEDYKEKSGSREAEKLAALKQKLRSQKDYPVEDYDSPEHLGELVRQDFEALVDRLFPEGAFSSPLEKERFEQDVFRKSMTGVYVPNPVWYDKLDAFAFEQNNERAIVITGGSGMGKSALLANWITWRELWERPEEKILYHFIGNSQSEGDYRKITRRLINELRDIYKLPEESSGGELSGGAGFGEDASKPDKQQEILQNLLFQTAGQGRLIIVLDGMDRLFDIDNAKLLNWLPAFPPNVKFIFSTNPKDSTYEVFTRRQYNTFPIEALPLEKRKRLIVNYLKSFGKDKAMTPARLDRIAADPESENPLALRALLEELRVFGSHEGLDREIDRYLAAPDLDSFFTLVLERLEKTYAVGDANIVRDVFSLIAVSRAGLSENEILELSGVKPLYWSQLFYAAAGHLTTRNGLVGFSHRFIREAVRKRYLSQDGAAAPYRRRIAAYIEKSDSRERKYDELPHQLFALKDWDILYAFLLDFDVFEYIYRKDQNEFGGYWRTLKETDAEKYSLKKYLELEEAGRDRKTLAALYNNIGLTISNTLGDYAIALEYQKRALEIRESVLGKNHPDTAASYHNIGFVYDALGDYATALEYQKRALEIREAVLGKNHPDTAGSYNNIGSVYHSLGEYPQALEYYNRALEIQESVLGENHPNTATSYNNIGLVYNSLGDYPHALEYYNRALEIQESVLGENHPNTATSYNNIGLVYGSLGDYPQALEYYNRALEIQESVLGKNHPNTAGSYHNIGAVYNSLGDYPQALEYYNRALEIRESVLGKNHPDTATSYHNIGFVYNDIGLVYLSRGNFSEALRYFKQALEIRESVLGKNHPDTATSYNNIGAVYCSQADYPEAMRYFKQALEIRESVLGKNHPDTAQSYNNIGAVYQSLGDYPQALEYFKQVLAIYEALGIPEADAVRESIKKLEEK
jgi:tetratricopeptide (TPR) repeat protein